MDELNQLLDTADRAANVISKFTATNPALDEPDVDIIAEVLKEQEAFGGPSVSFEDDFSHQDVEIDLSSLAILENGLLASLGDGEGAYGGPLNFIGNIARTGGNAAGSVIQDAIDKVATRFNSKIKDAHKKIDGVKRVVAQNYKVTTSNREMIKRTMREVNKQRGQMRQTMETVDKNMAKRVALSVIGAVHSLRTHDFVFGATNKAERTAEIDFLKSVQAIDLPSSELAHTATTVQPGTYDATVANEAIDAIEASINNLNTTVNDLVKGLEALQAKAETQEGALTKCDEVLVQGALDTLSRLAPSQLENTTEAMLETGGRVLLGGEAGFTGISLTAGKI